MTAHARIRSAARSHDGERGGVVDGRVHRRLMVSLERLGGSAGLALVEMKLYGPVARGIEQHPGERRRLRSRDALERNPARLIGVPVGRDLVPVACPPEQVAGLARALVLLDGAREVLLEKRAIPHLVARERSEVKISTHSRNGAQTFVASPELIPWNAIDT